MPIATRPCRAALFRRKTKLQHFHARGRQQVEAFKREVNDDPDATNQQRRATREHVAREREQQIAAAQTQLPRVEKIKKAQGKPAESVRLSTTDPEAVMIKMAGGGFRLVLNAQLATDTASQVIVGRTAAATWATGADGRATAGMLRATPREMLVDGGFAKRETTEQLAATTTMHTPV